MAKNKAKKTFLKIKEKLVFVEAQQKKFFTRKFFGAVLLVVGLGLLSFTFVSYFIVPRFVKSGINLELVKNQEFFPERVLFLQLGLDIAVKNGLIEEKFILKNSDFKTSDEILVLGKGSYQSFALSKAESKNNTDGGRLELKDGSIRLILPLKDDFQKAMIIDALKKY